MNKIDIFKALSNETRLNILSWLKAPAKHFPDWDKGDIERGVCCGFIQKKAGLSQSTISNYLSLLEKSNLLIATRYKQWTYYKRNEAFIKSFCKDLQCDL